MNLFKKKLCGLLFFAILTSSNLAEETLKKNENDILTKKSIAKNENITDHLKEKIITDEDCLFVSIEQGTVKGFKRFTPKGKSFYTYHGIQFAKPPIGDLRLKVIFL